MHSSVFDYLLSVRHGARGRGRGPALPVESRGLRERDRQHRWGLAPPRPAGKCLNSQGRSFFTCQGLEQLLMQWRSQQQASLVWWPERLRVQWERPPKGSGREGWPVQREPLRWRAAVSRK